MSITAQRSCSVQKFRDVQSQRITVLACQPEIRQRRTSVSGQRMGWHSGLPRCLPFWVRHRSAASCPWSCEKAAAPNHLCPGWVPWQQLSGQLMKLPVSTAPKSSRTSTSTLVWCGPMSLQVNASKVLARHASLSLSLLLYSPSKGRIAAMNCSTRFGDEARRDECEWSSKQGRQYSDNMAESL